MSQKETIKEFLVSLGYKVDGSSERKFKESVKDAGETVAALATAVAAAAAAFAAAMVKISSQFDQLYWSSQKSNAAARNIRAFSYAVSQMGGSAQGAQGSIEGLGRAMRNPGVASLIRSLGVATEKNGKLRDTVDIMGDLGKVLATKPRVIADQYAQILGIDDDTLSAMLQGTDKWRQLYEQRQKELGFDPDEAAKKSNKFMQSFRDLQATIQTILDKLGTDFAEPMSKAMDDLNKWLVEHKDQIKEALVQIGNAAKEAAEFFLAVATQLKPVWDGFDQLSKQLTGNDGLTNAFIALGAALSLRVLSPLKEIVKIIAGLSMPGWLMGLIGAVGVAANEAEAVNEQRVLKALRGEETNLQRLTREAAEARREERRAQGLPDKPKDERGFWERVLPKWLGGKDAPAAEQITGDGGPQVKGNALENAKTAYKFWREKGLSHEAASGILASMEKESGFDPGARGDGGLAHGLFQHHPDRRQAIEAGTGINMSTASVEDQLKGAYWEMTQGKHDPQARKAWDRLNTPGLTAAEYGAAFVHLFERPAADERASRGAIAERWARRLEDLGKEVDTASAQPEKPQETGFLGWLKRVLPSGAAQAKTADKPATPDKPADAPTPVSSERPAEAPKAPDRAPDKPAGGEGALEWIKNHLPKISANAETFDRRADATALAPAPSSVANDNSRSVTLHQKTDVNVYGGAAGDTAAEVARQQSMINAGLLRNAQGAVR